MGANDITIRTVGDAIEMRAIVTLLQQIWGASAPIVSAELLMAISHGGGYVAAVYDNDHAIGASFGFLADHQGERALHSHVTGLLPGVQDGGIGRMIKNHQRTWAAERDIPWVTWTFDPLVRGNAWFNVEVLGAHVTEYLVDFYGPITDAIDASDETDRLVVSWATDPGVGSERVARPLTTHVATPDDIITLRRTDPAAAQTWRARVRSELEPLLKGGGIVTGITEDGAYIVNHSARTTT